MEDPRCCDAQRSKTVFAGTKYFAEWFSKTWGRFHNLVLFDYLIKLPSMSHRYQTQTSENVIIEIILTELLKQSHVIPTPKKTLFGGQWLLTPAPLAPIHWRRPWPG